MSGPLSVSDSESYQVLTGLAIDGAGHTEIAAGQLLADGLFKQGDLGLPDTRTPFLDLVRLSLLSDAYSPDGAYLPIVPISVIEANGLFRRSEIPPNPSAPDARLPNLATIMFVDAIPASIGVADAIAKSQFQGAVPQFERPVTMSTMDSGIVSQSDLLASGLFQPTIEGNPPNITNPMLAAPVVEDGLLHYHSLARLAARGLFLYDTGSGHPDFDSPLLKILDNHIISLGVQLGDIKNKIDTTNARLNLTNTYLDTIAISLEDGTTGIRIMTNIIKNYIASVLTAGIITPLQACIATREIP